MQFDSISVIVPAYGVALYIDDCLCSIFTQTHPAVEILCIDDGSLDGLACIADSSALVNANLCSIHKFNSGVSATRNTGLDLANGNWISFVDADDVIDLVFYDELLYYAKQYDAQIIHCTYRREVKYTPQDEKSTMVSIDNQIDGLKKFLLGRKIEPGLGAKLYFKCLFENIRLDETLRIYEDYLVNFYLFSTCIKSVYLAKDLYYYRPRFDSVSSTAFSDKNFDMIKAADKVLEDLDEHAQIYDYALLRKIMVCFSLINKMIIYNTSDKRWNSLVDFLGHYTWEILRSGLYNPVWKASALLLVVCPFAYRIIILSREHFRGILHLIYDSICIVRSFVNRCRASNIWRNN
ncbi:hypothetical protein AGMMS49992_20950 [Clostridia bacterium]|nr:hypothetical protein AGMMS49992_20950 [Clostridia bacterium]